MQRNSAFMVLGVGLLLALHANQAVAEDGDDDGASHKSRSAVVAVRRNDLMGLKELLDDDDAAATEVDKKGNTALHWAARVGNLDMVNALLDASADVDAEQVHHRTPLMYASMHGAVEICRALLKRGATVNASDGSEETALMFAVRGGHTATVELLLSYGADASGENYEAETVLDMSRERVGHGGDAAERAKDISALIRQKLEV